jgi:flagellar hook-length control protein FliK
MICADVPSLARAAPNPAVTPRVSSRDGDSSFDQLLQAVTPDRSSDQTETKMSDSSSNRSVDATATRQTRNDADNIRQPVDRKDQRNDVRQDKDSTAEVKSADRKPSETKKTDDKPVNEKKTDDAKSVDEKADAKSAEDTVQEAIAGALAAQAAMAAKPDVKPETTEKAVETTAAPAAAIAVPAAQNQQQTPVIQLPDTDPQPLPDELKQAVQQTKVEVNDFKNVVDAASQKLDNQAQAVAAPSSQTTGSTPAAIAPGLQTLSAQEPAVKVVEVTAQPEDMAEVDTTKALTSVYASATAKTENLVETKPLPIIQKISSEVVELAREQGKSMKIQIQPENMGKIDLRLVSNSDGMRIVMTTEVPATAKLLETHMDQLQRQLADAGVSISGMSVNSQNAQGQSANASQNQSSGSGRPSTPVFQQESEPPLITATQVSSSGLDYRI